MIRQFFSTTVENLRSFLSSLSGSGRIGRADEPPPEASARTPQQDRRPSPSSAPNSGPQRAAPVSSTPRAPRGQAAATRSPGESRPAAAEPRPASAAAEPVAPEPEGAATAPLVEAATPARPNDPVDERGADMVELPAVAADAPKPESFHGEDTPVQKQAGGVVVNGEERAMVEQHTEPDFEHPVAENAGDDAGMDKDESNPADAATEAHSMPRHASPRMPRPAKPRPAHAFPTQSVAAPPVSNAAFGTTLAPQQTARAEVASSAPAEKQAEAVAPPRRDEAASEPVPEAALEIEQDTAAASAEADAPPVEREAQVMEQQEEPAPEPPSPASPPRHEGAGEDFAPIHALLESLLFVAAEPVPIGQLARTLELDEPAVHTALQELAEIYAAQNRGLRVQAYREKYQIVTAPAAAAHIERFLNLDSSSKLSGPALETLAVVAYRQPVTRSQIEAVRGVDCAAVLRSLVQRGLVEEVGRLDVVGRPFLYGVTDLFMQHFGLTDLAELPPLEQTEADALWATTALAELEGDAEAASAEAESADAPTGDSQSQPLAAEDRAV